MFQVFGFLDSSTGASIELAVGRIIIAGFTGRDAQAVAAHVEELRDIGVTVPETLPAFYVLPAAHLTTASRIEVSGGFTSGEVEPVVLFGEDGDPEWFTVGSDHTDRELEAVSIEESKTACPKPIASNILPLPSADDWDEISILSLADGEPYQRGTLASLLPFDRILAASSDVGVAPKPHDAWFLGTVPTLGQLRPAARFSATAHVSNHRLDVTYDVTRAST